jgi:2-polyprenyl-3-methyl-5-hydroxy-6-metoxy-1,4-benzoquinol methylase
LKQESVARLRCPRSGSPLHLEGAQLRDGRVEAGELVSADGAHRYPIVRFVPRFVPADNYAGNFGFQWNRFRRTQLDSWSGQSISRDRFYAFTGWTPEMLQGRRVLDVGCGAGRFTEVALAAGAEVTALDYSSAVDACWANHGPHPMLEVVQGDIYALPFEPGGFDFVYCLGVLQHTPDPHAAFRALPPQLRPGGSLAADLYPREALNILHPRYWLRPLTTRLPQQTLFSIVERLVPVLLPVSDAIGRIPRVGLTLRKLVPVANYSGVFDLSREQLTEWSVLDTFDWYSPRYDQPQSAVELERWLRDAELSEAWVGRLGFHVMRGRRAPAARSGAESSAEAAGTAGNRGGPQEPPALA